MYSNRVPNILYYMAILHGQAGSTTTLVAALQGTSYAIKSLQDIADFQRNYQKNLDAFTQKSKVDLAQSIAELEKEIAEKSAQYAHSVADKTIELRDELSQLSKELPLLQVKEENFFKNLINKVKYYFANTRKVFLDQNIENEAKRIYRNLELSILDMQKELEDKKTNTDVWVKKLTEEYSSELQWVQKTINDNTALFNDALSEERAIAELTKLPDEFIVINDYSLKFFKPFHNKEKDVWISTIVIDHIVIGPTGLFFIETKYWTDSMTKDDMQSSVQQILSGEFVLKNILNQAAYKGELPPFRVNMVPVPISPAPMVLLMNANASEPIEHVSIQTIDTIQDAIVKKDSIFAPDAIDSLKTFLLNKSNVSEYQSM